LAIATSAQRNYVEQLLEKNNIRGLFNMIVTNMDVKHPKPNADLLKLIAGTLDISMKNMVMIGDTEVDAVMAANAKCKFYMFRGNMIENIKSSDVQLLAGWSFLEKEIAKELKKYSDAGAESVS
jgi:phosphoglycolate phosphatase-like HAD superfamily hydrolase